MELLREADGDVACCLYVLWAFLSPWLNLEVYVYWACPSLEFVKNFSVCLAPDIAP